MTDKKTPDTSKSSDKKTTQSSSSKASENAGMSASITLTSAEAKTANEKPPTQSPERIASSKTQSSAKSTSSPLSSHKTTSTSTTKTPISKTAILALIIALLGAAGVAAIHWFHGKQVLNERQTLQQQLGASQSQTKAHVATLLEQQSTTLKSQLSTVLNEQVSASDARINQLTQKIDQLEQQLGRFQQNKSTDWLVHEAEYLIRISARTLWLEKNTSVAISLLKDADARLKELNDPQYLPTRQAIRNDIESLELLPIVDNESVLLSLNALGQQVTKLPLAMVQIPESTEQQDSLLLSENTADWQDNLAKTWRKFLADFITVRRRTGSVEPLMSPQHQQNLRENVHLKLQVAQWAVTKRQQLLYQQTLTDAAAWINEYFDATQLATQHFLQSIQELKTQVIDTKYPSKLSALAEIRTLLTEKPLKQLPAPTDNSSSTNELTTNHEEINKSENN